MQQCSSPSVRQCECRCVWPQCVRSPAGDRHQGRAGEGTQQRRWFLHSSWRDGTGAEGEDPPDTPGPEGDREWKRDGDKPCQGKTWPRDLCSSRAFIFSVLTAGLCCCCSSCSPKRTRSTTPQRTEVGTRWRCWWRFWTRRPWRHRVRTRRSCCLRISLSSVELRGRVSSRCSGWSQHKLASFLS